MKYRYIGSAPASYKGEEIKLGDEVEGENLSTTQFSKVGTPKKKDNKKK